jgi:oligopeptide/dipeptide ABC transporter ATP-binding protein
VHNVAVNRLSLKVQPGEFIGIVGESGSGKSSVARLIVGAESLTSGRLLVEGQERADTRALRLTREQVQMIFQDPHSALNPRRSVFRLLTQAYESDQLAAKLERKPREQQALELLHDVGLPVDALTRFPSQLSGGQKQRVNIGRALCVMPRLLVADEIVSGLDVSVQAQVLNLLADLQSEFGLSYIFIAHDLEVVRHVSDSVAVMYLGRLAETGPEKQVYERTRHPYTAALLSAAPAADPDTAAQRRRIILTGDVPSPINPPSGCRFHPRCPKAQELCAQTEPQLEVQAGDPDTHRAACHFPVQEGETLARMAGRERR